MPVDTVYEAKLDYFSNIWKVWIELSHVENTDEVDRFLDTESVNSQFLDIAH